MAVGVHRLDNILDSSDTIRIAILHDSKGKVLVLLPAANLLNLAVLWRESARQLQPVRAENIVEFFNQEGLSTPQGQKILFTLPVYLD